MSIAHAQPLSNSLLPQSLFRYIVSRFVSSLFATAPLLFLCALFPKPQWKKKPHWRRKWPPQRPLWARVWSVNATTAPPSPSLPWARVCIASSKPPLFWSGRHRSEVETAVFSHTVVTIKLLSVISFSLLSAHHSAIVFRCSTHFLVSIFQVRVHLGIWACTKLHWSKEEDRTTFRPRSISWLCTLKP